MRKIYFALLLFVTSLVAVFAGDVVKVLQVYSGGVKTSIPLSGIDSLDHSLYDTDSILYSDYMSSIIHAIDRDYQIPIASIDSIIFGEIDMESFEAEINEIGNFINEQTELEVNTFQTNLLVWLNANENIQEATINEGKDVITIKFKNGLDFYIDFQDIAFFGDIDTNESIETKISLRKASEDSDDVYYVASEEGEKIIKKPKILYIQGMDMFNSTAESEYKGIKNALSSSPLEIDVEKDLKKFQKSLLFLDESFSDYGLIIIAQTHGTDELSGQDIKGAFQVEDMQAAYEGGGCNAALYNSRGKQIYIDNKGKIAKDNIKPIFLLSSSLISQRLKGSDAIVFGSYCWSYGLTRQIRNNTVFGYETPSAYGTNTDYLIKYVSNMFHGKTHGKSTEGLEDYWEIGLNPIKPRQWHVIPKTNHPDSKQRYFSISIDDITKTDGKGYPIVTGRINGYDNLKKGELTPVLYVYNSDGIYVTTIYKGVEIKDDGKVVCEIMEKLNEGTYFFEIGFIHGGKVYYGDAKEGKVEWKLCPDGNHPHMIDLGLPSGTKWACCNVGASSPEEYGSYHGIVDDGEGGVLVPSLEQIQELLRHCSTRVTPWNSVNGCLFTGPNGYSIFLPAAGYINAENGKLYEDGSSGYYWSSSFNESNPGYAYYLYFWQYYGAYCDNFIGSYGLGYGYTVRLVDKN